MIGDGLNPRSDEAAAAGRPQALSVFMATQDRDRYLLRQSLTFLPPRRQSVRRFGAPFPVLTTTQPFVDHETDLSLYAWLRLHNRTELAALLGLGQWKELRWRRGGGAGDLLKMGSEPEPMPIPQTRLARG